MHDPLTDDEITDMLSATMHGSLPSATMCRVFSTLAETSNLRAERDALRAMLRRVEWSAGSSYSRCPACDERMKDGHADDCALAALLAPSNA